MPSTILELARTVFGRVSTDFREGRIPWWDYAASVLVFTVSRFLIMFQYITDFVDRYFSRITLRMVRWKPTSREHLKEVDQKILSHLPCIAEHKMVPIGNGQEIWSVTCNPQGQGMPLVLVHGMGAGVALWSMNLEALSRKRPVYAFDILGFGRSSRPTFSEDPIEAEEQFVNSIESYRKEMGLDKFILLGHSFGGYLSASYTLRYPQYVEHLILADPWGMSVKPSNAGHTMPFLFRVLAGIASHFNPMAAIRLIGPLGPHLVRHYRPGLAQIFADKFGDESLLHQYIYHCNAQSPSGETGFKSLTVDLGWAKRPMGQRVVDIPQEIPITFLYGSRTWMDKHTAYEVQSKRPDSYVDVQILRGAGHHVYADRWDLFNSLVNSITDSFDQGELPKFSEQIVERMRGAPTSGNLADLDHPGLDFEQPPGHGDENDGAGDDDDAPDFSVPDFGADEGQGDDGARQRVPATEAR